MRPRMLCALILLCLSQAAGGVLGQASCTQNYALHFDGVDDFLVVPHIPALNFNPTDPFTIEMWIRTTAVVPTGVLDSLLEKWNGTCATPYPFTLRLRPQGQVQGATYDAVNCSAGSGVVVGPAMTLNDGRWHHIAYERDASQISRLWVDGRLKGTSLFPPFSPTANTVPVYIGRRGPGGPFANFYEGDIDEVRISSVNRYTQAFNPPTHHQPDADTVMLLHFDEGSGTTVGDASPQANAGLLGGSLGATISDPTWVTSNLPIQQFELHSSVNGSPFDSSFKTFWAGQIIQLQLGGPCVAQSAGMAYSVILNFGPDALINGLTPPAGSTLFPTITGLNVLTPYSDPTGNAVLMGDGLGLAFLGVGQDIGLPAPVVGGVPVTFAFPAGLIPAGFDMRMQALHWIPAAPSLIFGITNQVLMQAQSPWP